ncbi:hypothetical protein [Kineosporia sp. NBRC 101731]|uniref:hypothetical protein n=1 Tax=Kineosporia sp. NBRC 101731 TaxID=3032199 RepID=UPI0024A4366F|nr:hypothetical protein [Kineosporia sp. NBRC 101731]GLY32033.1 hypothetical protein Kisp02_53980 [Kineosporia sp. NBRC 101731]
MSRYAYRIKRSDVASVLVDSCIIETADNPTVPFRTWTVFDPGARETYPSFMGEQMQRLCIGCGDLGWVRVHGHEGDCGQGQEWVPDWLVPS